MMLWSKFDPRDPPMNETERMIYFALSRRGTPCGSLYQLGAFSRMEPNADVLFNFDHYIRLPRTSETVEPSREG